MHEARFRLTHNSVYETATEGREVTIDMWCGRHADLLYVTGSDRREALAAVDDELEVVDTLERADELMGVTGSCLLDHQQNLLEEYLRRHDCLAFYPTSYRDGETLTRVIALESEKLTEMYHDMRDEFSVEVDAIRPVGAMETLPLVLFNVDVPDLSDRQREALVTAHRMGYYEIPRETTTEALADELGVERRTVEEHLRRAERKVVESYWGLLDLYTR